MGNAANLYLVYHKKLFRTTENPLKGKIQHYIDLSSILEK